MFGLHLPFYSPLLTGSRHANHLQRGWAKAVSAADLTVDASRGRRKVLTPRLTDISIASDDGDQVSAMVDMSTVGRSSSELAARIERITASLHAYQIKVERQSPAISRITVSFSAPRRPHYDPQTESSLDLEQFPIQLDPATGAELLLTKSILIGGEAESGKSNLVWYILSQLNHNQIPYRLWVIDPAGGVELADLQESPRTRYYVDRIGDISLLTEAFRKSMDERLALMKRRRQRRHFPTPQEPVEICLIDEILLAKGQLKGGDADSPLGEVLAAGRKALHIVIACSQLGQKDVIGQMRDLFPQRLCLRTRTQEMTDAVLGSQATADGANCHRISQRGEGFIFTDQSAIFEKFHAPLVRETQTIAQGGTTIPNTPPPTSRAEQLRTRRNGRTFVYQFFNQDHPSHPEYQRPCYVGVTDNPRRRFKKHEKDWPNQTWLSIQQSRTKIQAYPTWDEAKDMETRLIGYYRPIYNVQEIPTTTQQPQSPTY